MVPVSLEESSRRVQEFDVLDDLFGNGSFLHRRIGGKALILACVHQSSKANVPRMTRDVHTSSAEHIVSIRNDFGIT
jgi:hypothetical protein